MHRIIEYIEYYQLLTPEVKEDIVAAFQEESFTKNELLVTAGNHCQRMYFIAKGACRSFYYQEGKDVTSWIYPENEMVTNWTSFFKQKEAAENIQAIMDTQVYSVTYEAINILRNKHKAFDAFWTAFLEDQVSFIEETFHGFMFNTAKQRYDNLLMYYPDITRVANLGYIASMLGITQETLSRIRKMK
jgi:signal-transduction protein with cAMP-binding, CBS, and nucleotidyltransferase domain